MKKKKKTSNYPMYEFGTMIDNPYSDLVQNQINIAKADRKAQNNPWAKGLNMLGNLAIQYGTSMMNRGASQGQGVSQGGTNWGNMLGQAVGVLGTAANTNNQNQGFATGGVMGEDILFDESIIPISDLGEEPKVKGKTGIKVVDDVLNSTTGTGSSDLRRIRKIQSGVSNNKFGEGYYVYYDKLPSEAGFDYKRNREYISSEAYNNVLLNSPAHNVYLRELKKNKLAYGGEITTGAEVEGGEVLETPNGEVKQMQGPSHENGGIDILAPKGTEVFSKRLKGPDGKSMADRKIKREKDISKVAKLLDTNPSDIGLKNSYKRTKMSNEIQETQDMAKMQFVKNISDMADMFMYGGNMNEYAFGGTLDEGLVQRDPVTGSTIQAQGLAPLEGAQFSVASMPNYAQAQVPSEEGANNTGTFNFLNKIGDEAKGITLGDMVGMAGTLYSTFAPMSNTKANRAGDTPNINAFADYGQKALTKLDESKQFQNDVRDSALQNLELDRNATIKRARNSARSVNTMRALDIAADQGVNQAKAQIYNNFAQAMQNIFGAEASALLDIDTKVMSGEQTRDLADRQDRDNYYTQLGRDIATKGTGLQKIGYDVNQMKKRNASTKLINELSDNFSVDASGNISSKVSGSVTPESQYTKLSDSDKAIFNQANELGYNVTIKNGKLVYSGTDIEYDPAKPNKKYNRRK